MNIAFQSLFTQPVSIASLVLIRIMFGGIMLWECYRYFSYGWITRYFIEPEFHFKYYHFEWVPVLPGKGMLYVFSALAISSLLMALGAFYRYTSALFLILFVYVFLLDQALYLNHFYMVIIFALLMTLLPANRAFSVDAWLFPNIKNHCISYWPVWVLRLQLEIILMFAGIVKINADWLRGQPLLTWLVERTDYPMIGRLFGEPSTVLAASYGVILLHIVGAPLLLWRRTRLTVFSVYAAFHILNAWVFNIGIFPWLTLCMTTIFFPPDWPLQFINKMKRLSIGCFSSSFHTALPVVLQQKLCRLSHESKSRQRWLVSVFSIWFTLQLLVPLRYLLYPGNVHWTEEGHRFAWRMKLRDKQSEAYFHIVDPLTGQSWKIHGQQFLTKQQYRKMPSSPDMILQYAHFLASKWKKQYNLNQVKIYAYVWCSLNSRPPQQLIDHTIDLASTERNLKHAAWILPL